MKYKLNDSIIIEEVEDNQYLLYNTQFGTFATINSIGKDILDILQFDFVDFDQIEQNILKIYDVPESVIHDDIQVFLDSMNSKGFILYED